MIFSRKHKFHNPMIDALAEPCFVFTHGGRYSFCNAAARDILKILGYGQERQPEDHPAFSQILKFYGTGADNAASDITLGGQRYGLTSSAYEDGTLLRLIPVFENDTLMHLSSTLDIVPWGLLTLGLQSDVPMILHCNAKAGEFFQMQHKRLVGLFISDILNVFGITDDLMPMITSSKICHYDYEYKVDDKPRWLRFHFIPYVQKKPYCLVVIEETTENKIMEGQYLQSQRLEALGQLAGGVAHDFNNILSIIDGYARIAKKKSAEIPEAVAYMDHIAQAVRRGAALTGQLLTFGRHKVVKDMVVDLGALIRDQEPLIRPLMDASIVLSLQTEDDVFVKVAPDNICQILLNLCVNARDAMPDGGNLIVELSKEDNHFAVLRIIDTGCGMPPDVKAKMFDPFFTTKDQGKGTGLGLSMVYGLVKDMKGDIGVVSKVGAGTSITIHLPLSKDKPTVHEIIEDDDGNIHLNGFTALVAEDEPDLLNILSSMLEEMGIKVLRATNGNEALLIQEEFDGDIDFLLTDVVMPELNGVKLAELFGEIRPDSRVMFMSGYPASGLMSRVPLPEGAVMMPKPVDVHKLAVVIRQLAESQTKNMKDRWSQLTGQWRMA